MHLKSFRQFVVGLIIAIPCVLAHCSPAHGEGDSLRTVGVVPLAAATDVATNYGGSAEQAGTSLGDLQLRYLQSAAGAGARFSQSPLMPQYPGSDVRGANGEALPGFIDGSKIRNMAAYSQQPPIPSAAIRYQTASQADEQEMYQGAPPMTGAPLTDSACYILMMKAMDTGLAKMSEPQRVTAAAQAAGMAQAINLGNAAAECARQQAASAIGYCQNSMQNFTVDPNNKWNRLRDNIFVPMGILLLLPGAVLAQVKAIACAGSPVLGECNPFEGILRAIAAVFLIPGTYLVLNYGIDLSNSINQSINGGYQGIAGGDMYSEATAAQVRANPVRQPSENRNALDQPTAHMTPLLNGTTPFARYEGTMLENSLEDPAANIKQAPPERTDEAMSSGSVASRLMMSVSNAGLTGIWNILCAFQTAYMYYLWFVGPVVAGLWVWPIKSLREALPNWIEGVITLCFWSLFWNTVIMLMACFRGIDETGSVMNTALNFLATASVQYAFDFAGLVKAAGQEAAGMAMGAAQQAAQSSQGKKGGGGGLLGGITGGIGGAAGGLLGGLGGAANGLLGGIGLGAVGKEVNGLLTAGGAAVGLVAAEAGAVVGAGASLATGIAQVGNLGNQVSSFMGNLSNAVSTTAGGLVSDMSDIVTPPLSAISSTVNGVAGGISAALEVGMPPLQGVAGIASGALGAVEGAVGGVVGGIAGEINGVETGIVGGITGAINGVEGGIMGGITGAINGVERGIVGGITGAINGVEGGIVGGITGAISGVEGGIVGGITGAINGVETGVMSGIANGIGGIQSGVIGGIAGGVEGGMIGGALGAVGAVEGALAAGINGVIGGVEGAVIGGVMGSANGLAGVLEGGVLGGINGAVGAVEGGFVGRLNGAVGSVEGALIGGAVGGFSGGLAAVEGNVIGGLNGIIGAVDQAINGGSGSIAGAVVLTEGGLTSVGTSQADQSYNAPQTVGYTPESNPTPALDSGGGASHQQAVNPCDTSYPTAAVAQVGDQTYSMSLSGSPVQEPASQPTAADAPGAYSQPTVADAPGTYSQPTAADAPGTYSQPTVADAPGAYSQPTVADAPGAHSQPTVADAPATYSQPTAADAPASAPAASTEEQSHASGGQEHTLDLDKIAAESARRWDSMTPDQQREQTARDDAKFTEWQNNTPDGQAWKQQQDQQQQALADIEAKHQADARAEAQRVASSPEGQAAAAQERQQHQAYVDQMSGHQHPDQPLYRGIHFGAGAPSSIQSPPAQSAPPTVPAPAPVPPPAPAAGNEVLNSWFN
jgi:hypothetical protein